MSLEDPVSYEELLRMPWLDTVQYLSTDTLLQCTQGCLLYVMSENRDRYELVEVHHDCTHDNVGRCLTMVVLRGHKDSLNRIVFEVLEVSLAFRQNMIRDTYLVGAQRVRFCACNMVKMTCTLVNVPSVQRTRFPVPLLPFPQRCVFAGVHSCKSLLFVNRIVFASVYPWLGKLLAL